MSYPCKECDREFDTFAAAERHWQEESHEIGAWQGSLDAD